MDDIGKLIYAAHSAPSSGNLQNWKFIIVQDENLRKSIAEACYGQLWMATAPVYIVVCGNPDRGSQFYGIRGERLYTIQNCAAAVQNILLAAHDIGLGSCWVGAFEEDTLRDLLGIPEHIRPQAIITIGHAAEKPRDPPWKEEIYTTTYLNSYEGRIRDIDHVLGYHAGKFHKIIDTSKAATKKRLEESKPILNKIIDSANAKVNKLHKKIKERNDQKQ